MGEDISRLRAKPDDLSNAAHVMAYILYVPVTTPFDALLRPEFWSHVCNRFMIGNTVTVMPQDHAWRAELFVRDVGANWAKLAVMSKIDFEKVETGNDFVVSGFHVEWKNIGEKYAVVREKDNAVIAKGFKTKPEALAAMVQHAAQAA